MKIRLSLLGIIVALATAGCSTPMLEDHGQTRHEQQQAGFRDRSDLERQQNRQHREAQKLPQP